MQSRRITQPDSALRRDAIRSHQIFHTLHGFLDLDPGRTGELALVQLYRMRSPGLSFWTASPADRLDVCLEKSWRGTEPEQSSLGCGETSGHATPNR